MGGVDLFIGQGGELRLDVVGDYDGLVDDGAGVVVGF